MPVLTVSLETLSRQFGSKFADGAKLRGRGSKNVGLVITIDSATLRLG
jgi:hypothetical protein